MIQLESFLCDRHSAIRGTWVESPQVAIEATTKNLLQPSSLPAMLVRPPGLDYDLLETIHLASIPLHIAARENGLCGPGEWCTKITKDFKRCCCWYLLTSSYYQSTLQEWFHFSQAHTIYMKLLHLISWFVSSQSSNHSSPHLFCRPRIGFGADVDHSSSTLDKICCKVSSRCFTNFFSPADRCVAAAVMASATSLP